MLNTADDLGRPGPDYLFGYGRVNARRAVESLTANTFFEGDLSQGDSTILNIDVPSGAAELRVMLLWNDPAGAPFASPAITNDLDMILSDPSAQSYLPWVLDPSPAGVGLNAVRGHDSSNNHEQITIDNPSSGIFEITIQGSDIPAGTQHFIMVYEIIMPAITVIHPNGYNPLRPNTSNVIRWDAYGDAVGTFHVEYSHDGNTWETLSASVNQSKRYLNWTVPDTFAQNALIRVTKGAFSDSSDYNIVILDAPTGLTASSPCATFAELSWQSVASAEHYRIYRYVQDDMVVIDTTSNTNYTIPGLEPDSTYWFSVSAVNSYSSEGPRAAAMSVSPSSNTVCPWPVDMRIAGVVNLDNGRQNTSTELGNSHSLLIQIVNAGTDTAFGFDLGYKLNNGTPIIETFSGNLPPGNDTTYAFGTTEDLSAAGEYHYSIWVTLGSDEYPENDTLLFSANHVSNSIITLPWTEDFEAGSNISLDEAKFAFGEFDSWDYHVISGTGRLRTWAGNDFILDGQNSITLDASLYNTATVHDITATINLSAYDTLTDDVRLRFDFMHHELVPDDDTNDMVWVRGNDTSSWFTLVDLYTLHAQAGEIAHLNSGIEISGALKTAGQNFSPSFQLRFGQEGNASADSPGFQDGYTFDNIELFTVNDDIKLVQIESPLEAGCGLTNENISVRVLNTSNNNFQDVTVSFSIDGSPPVTETIGMLNAGVDTVFTFSASHDFSISGEYLANIWINHLDDIYHANDSILGYRIFSFPTVFKYPYIEDFETDGGGWLSSGVFNSFARGKPGAEIIHKAASGTYAWVTNLTGDYHHDEVSFLTSPCFDLSALTQPVLSFAHIQELENNYDFLWVEYSDNGGEWIKLGAVGDGTNWYNDAGEVAWDNVNPRWHVASIDVPVNSSQVQFRFAFTSDIGLQLEGVGIDAIHIHEKDIIYYGASASPPDQNVSGSEWVHFDVPEGRVLSIYSNEEDLGLVEADVFFYTGPARNNGNSYIYSRNWVVEAENVPVKPVKLRLYVTELDYAIISNASGCGNCVVPTDVFESESFKFSGTVEDSILTNNTSGVYDYFGTDDLLILPYDNGYVIEFEVADFSEFWLSGIRTKATDKLYLSMSGTSDDADEFVVSGGVNPYSESLDLEDAYLSGLRFSDVRIPQSSFIREANLIFTALSNQTEMGEILIFGESKDDVTFFNTGNFNISQRPKTELHFNWRSALWVEDDTITTPDLRAIFQEAIDRPGWQPGNAIGFSIKGFGDAQAYSFDADPDKAPKLFIIYDSICDLQQRLYVDTDATGNNTGDSWEDAMPDLQHALDLASRCIGITEIWVSEGIYVPAIEGPDRSFKIQNGIKLFGGFTGIETLLDQRDPESNMTVLSGDLGINGDSTDNAFHVLTVTAGADTVTLDGFTIKNGHAFGLTSTEQSGAGIMSTGNILLQNCTIEECSSLLDGSGIYHSGNNMTFILSNCTLRSNSGSVIKNTGAGIMIISDDNNIETND